MKIAAMPEIKGNPTPCRMAAIAGQRDKLSAQADYNGPKSEEACGAGLNATRRSRRSAASRALRELRRRDREAVPEQGDIGGECGRRRLRPAIRQRQQVRWKRKRTSQGERAAATAACRRNPQLQNTIDFAMRAVDAT